MSAKMKGRVMTPQHRQRIAAALRGKPFTSDRCTKIAAARKGQKLTLEQRHAISIRNTGHRHSDATKIKMSMSQRGHAVSAEARAKLAAANTGRKHSAETRAKVSAALRLRCGLLAPNWKGGITKENTALRNTEAIRAWRKAVFVRDGYTCQICSVHGGFLNAHHILEFKPWPQFRVDLWNGRTLCRPCHKNVHDQARAERLMGRS